MNEDAKILVKISIPSDVVWSTVRAELEFNFDAVKYKGADGRIYHVYLADGEDTMETLDKLRDWAGFSKYPRKIEVISMEISV